jgi:hypothetical protein
VALLAALIGCRDGPTTVEMPAEPGTPVLVEATARADVFLSIQLMLDDPLVLEVVKVLGDRSVADGFEGIRDELDRQTVQRDMLAVHRTVMATRDSLGAGASEGPDLVLRDVLQLVLDDAGMMLVGETDVALLEDADGDPVKH